MMTEEKTIRRPKTKRGGQYVRLGTMSVKDMVPRLGQKEAKLFGAVVGLDSPTLQCFQRHGTVCQICGMEGQYFVIEMGAKNQTRAHASLVGIENNREVLFTKDHIIPKSVGGPDTFENFRTTCSICNGLLGNIREKQRILCERMGVEIVKVNRKKGQTTVRRVKEKKRFRTKEKYYPWEIPLGSFWPEKTE